MKWLMGCGMASRLAGTNFKAGAINLSFSRSADMDVVSPAARLKSRNFEVEALRRVADVQYDAIAAACGCDKSTVSRMFGERGIKLAEIPLLLECLGWKVVSKDHVCIDRNIFESFKTIAATALSNPEKLHWEGG